MSVEQTLRRAAKLARSGDRAGAAALYREILAKFPANAQAKRGLQALAGGPSPAAAARRPGAAPARPAGAMPPPRQMQALDQAFRQGRFDRVIAEGQRLALMFPAAPGLLNLIALALSRSARHDEAVTWFDRAAKADPLFAGAPVNKAQSLIALGRLTEAAEAARAAARLDPGMVQAHLLLGYALVNSGDAKAGEASFRTAVKLAPQVAETHLGLGNALSAQHRQDEALAAFEAARDIAPDSMDAANNIGNTLRALNRPDEAVAELDAALERQPRNPVLMTNLARAQRDLGRPEQVIALATRALDIDPADADTWSLLASAHRELGDAKAAVAAYDKALEIDPDNPSGLALKWFTTPLTLDHPDFARIGTLFDREDIAPTDRATLGFILFATLDAAGRHDDAFAILDRANRLRREAEPYEMDDVLRQMDQMRALFADDLPAPPAGAIDAPAKPRPVLIVGMPRSGTTLVEQIVASHSQVHGAGELEDLNRIMSALGWTHGQAGQPPTPEALQRVRHDYLDYLTRLDTSKPVMTDKMPINFRWLGFLLSAIPEARVLFVRRDPMATCWSNYRHVFMGQGNNFGCDQRDTAAMYRLHIDLMAFWKARFPGQITEISYEALTTDQEAESRKLVAAIGLDWEEACLDFHKTRRAVRTTSTAQVRRKMYTGSNEAWRPYRAHLAPMRDALGPLADPEQPQ